MLEDNVVGDRDNMLEDRDNMLGDREEGVSKVVDISKGRVNNHGGSRVEEVFSKGVIENTIICVFRA
jgi:hypothetical protein